jgi:hypothetical protein
VPDFLFALATIAWTMAVAFVTVSFTEGDAVAGEAGANLARAFAAMLAISGLLIGIIGVILLRDERTNANHFRAPVMIGIVAGALVAGIFLWGEGGCIWTPFVLLILVFRPVRSLLTRPFRRSRA